MKILQLNQKLLKTVNIKSNCLSSVQLSRHVLAQAPAIHIKSLLQCEHFALVSAQLDSHIQSLAFNTVAIISVSAGEVQCGWMAASGLWSVLVGSSCALIVGWVRWLTIAVGVAYRRDA